MSHSRLACLLAVAASLWSMGGGASADSLLQLHRQAVLSHDLEQVSLSAVVAGRPSANSVPLTITGHDLAAVNLGSLDLVTLVAGNQSLPVRLLRSSIADQFLADNVGPNQDTDAVAALVFSDSDQIAQVTLVGYGGSIADAINAHNGMQVQIQVTRYRQ